MLSVPRIDRNAARAASVSTASAVLLALLLALFGCGQQGSAKAEAARSATADTVAQIQPSEPAESQRQALKLSGIAVLDRAAAAGKYLLVIFYRKDDDETRAMKKVVADVAAKLVSKANSISINVADAAAKDIVAKFGVDRAPMPLALVVAPTGAITGGFPGKVTKEQLSGAFVSPGLANSLKALQDGKLVLLCVQNASTKSNDAAMKGVNAFITDTRFAKSTDVVKIDPTDDQERKFLAQVQIDPKTSEAVTALIAPPGVVVAKYNGVTDKDKMIAALAAKQAGGG